MQITLITCDGGTCGATDPNIGPGGNGIETLNGTILPLSTTGRTFITEFDSSASGSGQLAPQDTTAAAATPAKGYAFVLNGYDHGGAPLAIGGIINIDNLPAAGEISGAGSISDANDDFSGRAVAGQTFAPSTASATDQYGRFFFTLNSASFSQIVLVGYVVDANQIRLVETSDPFSGTLGGVAYSQSNGTVTTGGFTAANVAGTYVVGMSGTDTNNPVLQVVNQLTLAAGAVTGFVDYNDIATSSGFAAAPATSPDSVTATAYALDASGAGDVTISNINDGTAGVDFPGGVGYNLQLYLDGNGHALAISMDGSDAIAGVGFTQSGSVPFAATSFTGPYALDVTGADAANTSELDGAGPVSNTGSAETISGAVDLNWLFNATTYPATALSGTFATT